MSVDYFNCESCGKIKTEFDEIHCEECGSSLCTCAMPEEIKELCSDWDSVYTYIADDYVPETDESIIVKRDDTVSDETFEIFKKYLSGNFDDGVVLKKEHCPICQKRKGNEGDPEYQEYLRLKAKFES